MKPRPVSRRAQRGLALLGLLAVIVMVFAYVITSRLNAASQFVALDREENAHVMSRAKAALIGYVAQKASLASENYPGRLPCPEAPAYYGTANEGIAAGSCTLPAVGRLPWRTLGVEKLTDAAGEPLWYVVSAGWGYTSPPGPVINPDTAGQLTVDGAGNDSVALIIAPGPAIVVQTSAGCTAWAQARPISGAPDKRNYLECGNASNSFVSSAPGATFNDQIVRVTQADVMPGVEAAVQVRMQREIAPAVRSAAFELNTSATRQWIASAPLASDPALIYPYPVPFTTPTTSLSNYRGAVGTNQGLMPFAPVAGFVSFYSTPANVIKITSAGSIYSISCYWESATVYACEGLYDEDTTDPSLPITVEMTATFTNAGMGFRARNTGALTAHARNDGDPTWLTSNISTNKRLELNDGGAAGKPRGSVTARLRATLPNIDIMGWGNTAEFRLRMSRNVVADHPIVSDTGRALRFSGGFSAINNGNTVTGATSGASGAVQVVVDSGTWSGGNAAGLLFFSNVSGTFQSGEALRVGGSSKATSVGTDFDIGWFARNEWYRNVYYAVAAPNLPDTLPAVSDCISTDEDAVNHNCLRYNTAGVHNTRVLLVIAGRRLDTQLRPSTNFADYIEYQNADNGTFYEQRRMRSGKVVDLVANAPWNDRLVIVDWKTPVPTFPIAYLQ